MKAKTSLATSTCPSTMAGSIRTACTRLLALLLALVLPAAVQAQEFSYTINNGMVTITGYTGPGGEVTIPDTIEGLPVTGIGAAAFLRCTSLSNVTIPDSVTSIEGGGCWWPFDGAVGEPCSGAFSGCTSLTNVTIGNSVTNIGSLAFRSCTSLTSVIIPDSVTSIGWRAFSECTNLTRVTIPDSVTTIGDDVFHFCYSLTSVTIGNSVTSIGDGAFSGCTNLTSVTIPESVTNIDWSAFDRCLNLTSVTIGNSVTAIGGYAFSFCTSLTGLYFQGNAPVVHQTAFAGASNATVYYLPGTTGWGATFGGRPTAPWYRPNPVILTIGPSFGVQTNRFGFRLSWATNASVAVEACTNMTRSAWSPVGTNTLNEGWSYFSDPDWTNHPARSYRLRSQ